jgi:chemosensory pili system protein ChpA (sensor histidine kinase/response regulator)
MTDISSQTLHIVAKELAATLNDARASLEGYAERPDQRELLEKCADQLHSAHGVLRLVEVYGAALLAEEMEHVTRYLLSSGSDQKRQVDGLDALMRAMVQLPTYLERVLSGGRDLALVLLPLLNDLRSVRGSPLLSEGTLLLLNLKSDQNAAPQSLTHGEQSITVAQWARRLRPRFQIGLLGYIRGERTVQNLEILAKVTEKLEQVATTQPVFQLWWVTGAVLEAVRANGLEGSATLKRLLGQADRQIKALYELGEAR